MSAFVYALPIEYQNIIKYIAEHGYGNITNIAKYTKNSENYPLERWAVKKRIYGTSRFQGLLDTDYVIEKLENKYRYKKQERTFYLTSKGIIASLATTPLKNNISFKKIIEFANNHTKGKNQSKFIEEFIISQLKYFLAYQYIQGTQLTWQKNAWEMYSKFLSDSEFALDVEIKDKKIMSEFRKLFEDYVVLRSIYYFLGGKTSKDTYCNIALWKYIDKSNLPKVKEKNKAWDDFVFQWFVSPQPQFSTSEEFSRMNRSDIPEFVADQHMFTKEKELKKRLLKKIKKFN